jgi:hypothetical protein
MLNPRLGALIAFVLAAAATRLLPHPPNMTSIASVALFGGAYFKDRRLAFAVPLLALLLSDLALGWFYQWSMLAYQSHMEIQYLCFALIVVMGFALRTGRSALRIASASLFAAVVFFVVTNFGEWLFQDLYPRTLAGLAACYVAAIPFFGNSVLGDLLYSALLFGGFRLLETRFTALREPQLAL